MIKKWLLAGLTALAFNAWPAVDVNTASPADLDSIKGIGPSTSTKLLEVRKAGKFKDWADLIARMPGIGEKRAMKLSAEGLTVNGEAFKPAAGAPAKPTNDKAGKPAAAPAPKQ
jgi:competence protein ComEA